MGGLGIPTLSEIADVQYATQDSPLEHMENYEPRKRIQKGF